MIQQSHSQAYIWRKSQFEKIHAHQYSSQHYLQSQAPFVATWMDLEIVILSEVRQRKLNIIYFLYVESKKRLQMNLSTKQK